MILRRNQLIPRTSVNIKIAWELFQYRKNTASVMTSHKLHHGSWRHVSHVTRCTYCVIGSDVTNTTSLPWRHVLKTVFTTALLNSVYSLATQDLYGIQVVGSLGQRVMSSRISPGEATMTSWLWRNSRTMGMSDAQLHLTHHNVSSNRQWKKAFLPGLRLLRENSRQIYMMNS